MWRDIEGYEGYYEVSDSGEVRSLDRTAIGKDGVEYFYKGRQMRLTNNKCRNGDGYNVVNLHMNGVSKVIPVHRLVARAFLPNQNNCATVNHKDGNKRNNNVSNLEWATYSENNIHALKTGLRNPRGGWICQKTLDGDVVAKFRSVCEASRLTGVGRANISHCVNRRANSAGGFVWRKLSEGITTISQESTSGVELPVEVQERREPKI